LVERQPRDIKSTNQIRDYFLFSAKHRSSFSGGPAIHENPLLNAVVSALPLLPPLPDATSAADSKDLSLVTTAVNNPIQKILL